MSEDDAKEAVRKFDDSDFNGSRIVVKEVHRLNSVLILF
jgi:hypothetical protein